MLQRHVFNIVTDTSGDWVDTGPPITGMVLQTKFSGGNFDTGVDLKLELINSGAVVLDWDNVGSTWTRVPRIGSFDTGGAALADQYLVVAHDRLRLTVNQSEGVTGSKTGTLYVWTGW